MDLRERARAAHGSNGFSVSCDEGEALIALWDAELAYDKGVDGVSRRVAWKRRDDALDRLAELNAKAG